MSPYVLLDRALSRDMPLTSNLAEDNAILKWIPSSRSATVDNLRSLLAEVSVVLQNYGVPHPDRSAARIIEQSADAG